MALPDGVVTFLFTDVVGSTRLWEESPDSMMEALRQHDDAIEGAAEDHGGVPVRPRGEGDSRFVVFTGASDAVAAAAEIQRLLAAIEWATPRPLLVRLALHTGTADLELGDYYGSAVNRAARLRAIAHGGQSVMSASTWELVQDDLPPGVTVRDMGEHGLKDLTRPEHVYQIDIVGLPDSFPPLASLEAVPNNLPIQLTDFVGRQVELEDAKRTLAETRLLTILAPGGAGKTRLAIQVGADLSGDFADGVFFVDLAPISAPADIIQTVAESIGIALSTDEDLQVQLVAYLAAKTQLLVFDNFEHVAEGADIVAELLKGAPRVKVIVTSRSKLSIKGETVMTLPGLEIDWDTAEEAFLASSVQLFIDASKRTDASFTLAVDELEPLGRILHMVGGMPLGIELAAAWVDMLPIGEIATEIAKSLDFLESEVGGVPDRHRSVRAVFDYSWTMLSEDERRMFSALSVFRGGFTRKAAEAVAGASIRDLANLASKSLLIPDLDSGRYSIHELLRQYAEAALHQDKELLDATMAAHMRFYANLTAGAEELISLSDQQQALRIVEDDLDNIRGAWRSSLESGNAAAARKFVFALWFLHEIRGWHQAAVGLFGDASEALEADSGDDATEIVRAAAAAMQAWFVILLGQPDVGTGQATDAVAKLALHSDSFAHVLAIFTQCAGLIYMSRWEELRVASTEAVRIADEAGIAWLAVGPKTFLVFSGLQLGSMDTDGATRLLDEGEAALSRHGEYRARIWILMAQARIALMENRPLDAIDLLHDVVESSKEIRYRRVRQLALQYLGDAQVAEGDIEAADAVLLESLAMSEEMGQVLETAGLLARLARVRSEAGKQEEAVAILASVLADPASSHSMIVENIPIGEAATELLVKLEKDIDPQTYAAAYARGRARSLDVTAKELLAT